ncbi:uncharacterized protein [Anoplolepis gracilipes]
MFGGSGLLGYGRKAVKSKFLFTLESFKRNWELIPLAFVSTCAALAVPFMTYHRLFVSTIDVQMTDYQRFEIPSVPRFYDLRNPRSLKLITFTEYKPAIHLDNRYRLMRHEPMLDAEGKETNKIGEDH